MSTCICVGTSGWSYQGWIGNFYPEKIKPNEVLPFYVQKFNSVELNNSFYQIPSIKNINKWKEMTPADFIFSCKANRYLTHIKKLQDIEDSLKRLLEAFSAFEEKLGPILFQFPPYWSIDLPRLENFIKLIPESFLCTFEFRHKSWFVEPLYDLLTNTNHSLCFYDFKEYQSPQIETGSFIYLRMHGPLKDPYKGSYSDETLNALALKFKKWRELGKSVFCYFDNDEKARAPIDALRLNHMVLKS